MSTDLPADKFDPSEWISQAEAARLQGVSRQAISKLVRTGRLKSVRVGGHVLVSRRDISGFSPLPAGRPASGESQELERITAALAICRPAVRQEVFRHLRQEFPIHPLEAILDAKAEVILEAIQRASPLTLRGIKGVLAEVSFEVEVINKMTGWISRPVSGDPPFDFVLDDGQSSVRVQVKLQRSKAGRPMMASEGYRSLPQSMFVVETQRTRAGQDKKTSESTRPYRFGEFDILAVAMAPSTKRWDSFLYTVADWLLPSPSEPRYLLKFQPVPSGPDPDWTDSFETCVQWLRSGAKKTINSPGA